MNKNIINYLNVIFEATQEMRNLYACKQYTNPLIAFRGEPKDYGGTKLMPSIFRDATLVAKEKHLFELICDYELIDYRKRNIDKAIETQHYVSISRMLDITFNSAVALYFACLYDHISDAKTDGYIYIFCFPEYYSPHSNYIEDFYDDVLNSKSTKSYFKNFKVFSHSYSNDRIKAQSGGFIFFPGEVFSPINDVYYRRIRIAASDKDELKNELELMFHINFVSNFRLSA